jgi:hypothetical protein
MPPKKRIYAPKGQKTLSSFINHEKDSNNNNAHSHIDMEIGDESQYSVTDDTTDMESTTVNDNANDKADTKTNEQDSRKYRVIWEKLWPWLYFDGQKMLCKKKNSFCLV